MAGEAIDGCVRNSFRSLWEGLHRKPRTTWADNPEVWRTELRRAGQWPAGPQSARTMMMAERRPIVHFFSATQRGEPNRVLVLLAGAMAARGIECVCVMPRTTGRFLKRLPAGVRLVDLETERVALKVWRLSRLLRQLRPAAIVAPGSACVIPAMAARWLAGIRAPIVAQQRLNLSGSLQRRSLLKRMLLLLLVRYCYRRADRIIAVSGEVAEDIANTAGVCRDHITVIPSSTVTLEIGEWMAEPAYDDWLDRKSGAVVLAVGALTKIKDHATLLQAFAMLQRRRRDARLVILGEGPERPRLEDLARTYGVTCVVRMLGHVDNPYAFMARADVLAHTSRYEGYPNVIIEALACGCPVVATDCPWGPAEILERGRYGRLVQIGDVAALSKALEQTLDDVAGARVDYRALQQRGRQFSVGTMLGSYLGAIDAAIRENTSRLTHPAWATPPGWPRR